VALFRNFTPRLMNTLLKALAAALALLALAACDPQRVA
jgi:hypothetical protein